MLTFALIPAAGKSTRMGRPKLALPVGERTVLECAVAALRQAQITEILVVVSPQAAQLAALAESAGARVLQLVEETPDMQSTVMHGLAWLDDHFHPEPADSWLLLPADHPALNPEVIRELLRARTARREYSIFVPTYTGRRGHPTLIGWQHTADLRAWPAGQGLNQFLRQKAGATCEWPVSFADILFDLDTPEDYQRLLGLVSAKR
jgi:molybdenum cofactor cytidylyltransferase